MIGKFMFLEINISYFIDQLLKEGESKQVGEVTIIIYMVYMVIYLQNSAIYLS